MAKHGKKCCGKSFRNDSALNQHARDKHPGRPVKPERPARKGRLNVFILGTLQLVAAVLIVQAINQYAGPAVEKAAPAVLKTVFTPASAARK